MTFSEWLLQEAEKADLSFAEIARRGGISHARISQVISGESPGWEFCLGIARGLKLPPETILRRAGILPSKPNSNERGERLLHHFNRLSEADQELAIALLEAMVSRYETPQTATMLQGLAPST